MSIDWTKPVYSPNGVAWMALFTAHGGAYVPKTGERLVYQVNQPDTRMYVQADGTNDYGWKLTNAPPVKDWTSEVVAYSDGRDAVVLGQFVKIRYGIRNGKPFAEVNE